MRGKAAESEENIPINRITPAYAGKSDSVGQPIARIKDHPRLCGEKQLVFLGFCHCRRITPAYAGKSFLFGGVNRFREDHPRLCGEKPQIPLKNSPIPGSPPPMRGKGCIRKFMEENIRITPAYAGKSRLICKEVQKFRDHPRLCGEKSALYVQSSSTSGSPPPMRGKVQ